MIRKMLFAFALLIALPAAAQDLTAVPLQMEGHIPVANVLVNGKGPFRFGIDTAMLDGGVITAALAQQLELAAAGEGRVRSGSLQLSTAPLAQTTFRTGETGHEKLQGLIGLGAFEGLLLTLDYPGQQIRLARGSAPAGAIDYLRNVNGPLVSTQVSGSHVPVVLDTTNSSGLLFPFAWAVKLRTAPGEKVIGQGKAIDRDFSIQEAQLGTAIDIRLGAVRKDVSVVGFTGEVKEPTAGYEVLRNYAITFDAKNNKVAFQ